MNVNFNIYQVSFGVKNKYRWGSPVLSETSKGNAKLQMTSTNTGLSDASIKDIGVLRAKHVSEVVLMYDTPEQIAAYVKRLNQKVEEHDRIKRSYDEEIEMARGVVTDVVSLLDCKIDFNRLGIDPEDLTNDEAIEYGSKFAFWTTSINGAPRNGRERPGIVRSANEFMALVEEKHPLYAAGEFEDIIKRLSPHVLKNDRRIQDSYDAEYARACIEYQKLPFSRRLLIFEPTQKYSPIYGNLTRLEILREQEIERINRAREESRKAEYQNWLDNAFMNSN